MAGGQLGVFGHADQTLLGAHRQHQGTPLPRCDPACVGGHRAWEAVRFRPAVDDRVPDRVQGRRSRPIRSPAVSAFGRPVTSHAALHRDQAQPLSHRVSLPHPPDPSVDRNREHQNYENDTEDPRAEAPPEPLLCARRLLPPRL